MPMVILEDGTKICQSNAIMNYLAKVYHMVPEDPLADYYG
jgi:glutathione S-transferase